MRSVRTLEGQAVWEAGQEGKFDLALLNQAAKRFQHLPLPDGQRLEEAIQKPVLLQIEYVDGLKASILNMDGSYSDWCGWFSIRRSGNHHNDDSVGWFECDDRFTYY